MALGVSTEEVAACGDVRDEDAWLLVETLTHLADRGDLTARELVASRPPEDEWRAEESSSVSKRPLAPVDAPVTALLETEGPWTPRPAVLNRLRQTTDSAEIAALLAAAQDQTQPGFRLAMRVLGERGDPSMIGRAGEILSGDPYGIPRVACHEDGTGVAGFLPGSWDHLGRGTTGGDGRRRGRGG